MNKTLKKSLANLTAAAVVSFAGYLGFDQIQKSNQEKETLKEQRKTLIQKICSNTSLNDIQSYSYSDELKAFQILINHRLAMDKKIKEDGFLPNSENGSRKSAEFEKALEEMSPADLKILDTDLSEKIDMTILESWSNGDISTEARSTFNRIFQRRAEKNSNDGSASKEVQRALNAMGANLIVDGEFGPKSKKALDAIFLSKERIQSFSKNYKAERLKTQRSLIKNVQKAKIR